MFKKLSSKKFKMGAYGTAITAVVLVLVIAVNIVSILLTDRANLYLDLTKDKAFEVSENILDVFKSIDVPMKVTVLYSEQGYENLNAYCAQVKYILTQAQQSNEKITVTYSDPIKNPEVASAYPGLGCTQGDMIVENMKTGKAIEIPFSDLFYFGGSSISGSKAEAVIASRMVSMTSGYVFKVSFSQGHNEAELGTFTDLLSLNNYTITKTKTVTEDIEEDVSCLIIAGPSVDFSTDEIRKLEQFMYNGGEYGKSILYFASIDNLDLPNLEAFLANYGVTIGDELVAETNSAYIYGDQKTYALSGYLEEKYAAKALSAGLYSISPYTRPLTKLFDNTAGVRITPLMCFSNTAIAINPLDSSYYIDGSKVTLYSALLSEQYKYESGVGEKVSRVAVFGSVFFAEDSLLSTDSLGNAEYLVGVMSQLAPNEISIQAVPKTILGGYMSISAKNARWLGVTFAAVLPIAVIALGFYIYIKRRNR